MQIGKRIGIFLIIFALSYTAWNRPATAAPGRAHLVWSQGDAAGNHEIYYSRCDGGFWGLPVRITDTPEVDTMPAVATGKDGSVWVVWSAIGRGGSRLIFSRFDGASWSEPAVIETGFSENTAPRIFIDGEGQPWVVWSGFDGTDDDIFTLKLENGRWTPPIRINNDDAFPDILPVFSLDSENQIRVTWKGFDGERYREYVSRFSDNRWETEQEIKEVSLISQPDAEVEAWIRSLPEFLEDKTFAALEFPSERGGRFIWVQDVAFQKSNALLKNSPSNTAEEDPNELLTFGDSITVGYPYYLGDGNGNAWGGYQPALAYYLSSIDQTETVLNFGVTGENTLQGLLRIQEIFKIHPVAKLILILEGTNDIHYFSRTTTYVNWRLMADICLAHGIIPVMATLTPDTRTLMNYVKQIRTTYNVQLRKIVLEKGIPLCELYDRVKAGWNAFYTEDGIHPNWVGYWTMAQIWFDTLVYSKLIDIPR